MKTLTENLHYQRALAFLKTEDLGRALIAARDGLKAASETQNSFLMAAFQSVFAQIHWQDGDPDSTRRAAKLMKQSMESMSSEEKEWIESEWSKLQELLEGSK